MSKLKQWFIIISILTACIFSGCINSDYQGRSYPDTSSLQILKRSDPIPNDYEIIGRGWSSGEFSAVTPAELQAELVKLGCQHGANAMIVIGSTLVDSGQVAASAANNFIVATDDPDQVGFETALDEDIQSNRSGTNNQFLRIMYADFLRKKSAQ